MRFPLSGRVRLGALVVVVLGLAAGGIAYASIPDSGGVIHGCYQKSSGTLHVIGTNPTVGGGACSSNENALDWNQTGPQGPQGPQGPTGPAGTAGPTSLADGSAFGVTEQGSTLITHTVTADEAGLTILTNPFLITDNNSSTGGGTIVICGILINGGAGLSSPATVSDRPTGAGSDMSSATSLLRETLATGDVVTVFCHAGPGDSDEANIGTQLLLERVGS